MTKQDIADKYISLLKPEGFDAKRDKDDDVFFKYEGGSYIILIDPEDTTFFRMSFPNFWEIKSEVERAHLLKCADQANRKVKAAKVFSINDNMWACIESYVGEPEIAIRHLLDNLRCLQIIVKEVSSQMETDDDPLCERHP